MTHDADSELAQLVALASGEGLCRSYYDTLTGVDTEGVEVLHVTYGDAVVIGVAHYLILDLLPTLEALLNEHLG